MFFVDDLPVRPLVWQVCFVGKNCNTPWDRFLAPGFRHVYILGYLAECQMWLKYEVLYHRTDIALFSPQHAGEMLQAAVDEGAVLSWPAGEYRPPSWFLRFGLWCVPAMKHALGLRCVALTPKQLHDFLRKNGAKPLLPEEDDVPVRCAEG